MATSKPRFPITIEPEIAEIIENYRHQHKINSTSKATVELLIRGIEEFYRRDEEHELQKNKAPTAEEAEEAMRTILHYRFNRKPLESEMELFSSILPIIVDGLKDKVP